MQIENLREFSNIEQEGGVIDYMLISRNGRWEWESLMGNTPLKYSFSLPQATKVHICHHCLS